MGRIDGKDKEGTFEKALLGKKIPILTLDNKWYKLLNKEGREYVKPLEDELNALLKRQGKINTESKDIRNIKKKLMNDIVSMVDEVDKNGNHSLNKQIDENRRLLEDCNKKLEDYQDEMMDIPREIDRVNKQLMLATMEYCYEIMQDNTDEIMEIAQWVTQVRIDLKKRLVRKQEMEQKNHFLYSYMHDVFGPEVIELFDMRYNPEEHHPKPALKAVPKPEEEQQTKMDAPKASES